MMILPFPVYVSRDVGLGMSKEAMESWVKGMPMIRARQNKMVDNINATNELLKRASKDFAEGVETRR